MKFFCWSESIFWHAHFLNKLIRSCSFMNSVWQSYSCNDMILELLWCWFPQSLNQSEAESWLCCFFRHYIAVFVSSLKQIHDVSLLLKMKHFLNATTVCFLSEFDQNALAFKKSVRIFFLWFIWVFFCDVYWDNLFLVSD